MADHKIQWNGLVDDSELDSLASADNNEVPTSVDLGIWGGKFEPCWTDGDYSIDSCKVEDMYLEDFDLNGDGEANILDVGIWDQLWDREDIADYITNEFVVTSLQPDKAPTSTQDYTWGDVAFVLSIFDGIGSSSRRAREKRLQDLDKDKKKRLIRLICRVKGEKVYDETKEVGDIELKLDDVDMVINKVVGTMKVSTEWKEVPWDYGYDK